MTHTTAYQNRKRTIFFYLLPAFLLTLIFSSCGINKDLYPSQEYNNYSGTVILSNGDKKVGRIGMPTHDSKTVLFSSRNDGSLDESINAEDIERIEFSPNRQSNQIYIVRYMPVKGTFNKKSNKWVVCISEGPHVSAYVGAASYRINADGSVSFGGVRQVINHGNGTAIVNPSFPVYMMKKGDDALTNVALTKGISFEDSAFRSGLSNFLHDDPKLSQHMRDEKWNFEDMNTIVQNYNPHRGDADLVVNGETVTPKKRSIITNDLNKEMLWYVEAALPSDKHYGPQFGIGIRSTIAKFFTYGVDLGYASAEYLDEVKRIENHPGGNWTDAPVIDEDFSKQGLFRLNGSVGAQLPLDLKKVYLIPGAHLSLGGMFGTDYSTLYYGPMGTLDIGFKLGRGNILFIGAGYRHLTPLKSDEAKEEHSAPGFKAYEPYGNVVIRAAYKF